MPDWFAITGAITNVATAIDLGFRYNPNEVVNGPSAEKMLEKIDKILNHSNTVLENHKGIMEEDVYENLKDKYRVFHWQMSDESQGERAIRDQIIRQSRILSQLYSSKESRQDRARELLASVERYQVDVLSASEAAHRARKGKALAMFPDVKSPPESSYSAPKSFTSWVSVFGGPARQNAAQTDIESARSPETSSPSSSSGSLGVATVSSLEEGYIVAVTHLPDTDSQPTPGSGSDDTQPATLYRRMVSFEGAGKRIDIIDTKRYAFSENEAFIDEKSLCDMTLLGKRFLDGGVPEDSRITDIGPNGSLESTIESFRRMSTSAQT
ncbi:hypothetical protein FRC08_003231 [Ceratobasidium sp. 394]|nr:hypothetical protein FRC08_003231 [Ceratobasidium sp. 394]